MDALNGKYDATGSLLAGNRGDSSSGNSDNMTSILENRMVRSQSVSNNEKNAVAYKNDTYGTLESSKSLSSLAVPEKTKIWYS